MGSIHEMTCANCVDKIISGKIKHTENEKELAEEAWELLKQGNKK
jgi:uncharacterized radical SAM superfamily protein